MLGKFDEKCRNAHAALMTRHGLNKARGPFQRRRYIMTEKQQKDSIIAWAHRGRCAAGGSPLISSTSVKNPFAAPPETRRRWWARIHLSRTQPHQLYAAAAISCQRVIKRIKLLSSFAPSWMYCGTLCGCSFHRTPNAWIMNGAASGANG